MLGLTSSEETLLQFPWHFDSRLTFSLHGSSLELLFEVENRDSRPMPFHLGYHPYFHVSQAAKSSVRVETDATRAWDNRLRQDVSFTGWDFTGPEVDLHLLDHSRAGTTLHRGPGRRPVHLSWSPEFRKLIVWTLQGRDFICVEPWTASAGALATGEGLTHVPPGQLRSCRFAIHG